MAPQVDPAMPHRKQSATRPGMHLERIDGGVESIRPTSLVHPMSICKSVRQHLAGAGLSLAIVACGTSDTTTPIVATDVLQLTTASVSALDSTARIIAQANPTNGTLRSLVDSTLLVFTAGVQARRLDVTTNLTSAPLYFVGIHRVFSRSTGGSSSAWTLVGMDDPAHLANLVEVSGFAQSAGTTAPALASGTIGDGTGIVNALLLQVANGGSVTQWNASSGSASFQSDAAGAVCPGFTATPKVTCALESMHVHFSANAASGSGGAAARQASVTTDVDVPAMRLTYTP
jgi:hypothetical protein